MTDVARRELHLLRLAFLDFGNRLETFGAKLLEERVCEIRWLKAEDLFTQFAVAVASVGRPLFAFADRLMYNDYYDFVSFMAEREKDATIELYKTMKEV